MKTVALQRLDNYTYGHLTTDNGQLLCWTLEWPWDDNKPNVSRIPAGTYPLYIRRSHLNGGTGKRDLDVWELADVSGREAIEIHVGNTHHDTEGCILLGQAVSVDATPEEPRIAESRTAFFHFMTYMADAEETGAVIVVADPIGDSSPALSDADHSA